MGWQNQGAALYLHDRGFLRLEFRPDVLEDLFCVHLCSASEHVQSTVTELRPRVDRHMGFSNDYDARDSMGGELVKAGF